LKYLRTKTNNPDVASFVKKKQMGSKEMLVKCNIILYNLFYGNHFSAIQV